MHPHPLTRRAAALLEYALLLGLVVVALLGLWSQLGGSLAAAFRGLAGSI